MIKGSLKDCSLPGLLQFLSNEATKSYRVKIERGSLHGDVVITNGDLVSASYGLLRGEDALCEFLTWEDGAFWIERLSPRHEGVVEKNINLRLQQGNNFADQASYLLDNSIGLNTIIRSSRMFGTPEWQESSKLHPLQREDFLILGWLSEGRTMRQSMREFAFDLIQATAILYRLVLTRSVEVVRAGDVSPLELEIEAAALPTVPLAQPALTTARTVVEEGPAPPPPAAAAPPAGSAVASPAAPAKEKPAEPPEITVPDVPDHLRRSDPGLTSRRTTVLPIISIDIERLMKATFTISQFGFLALKNPALDESIRTTLLKVEAGTNLETVVAELNRPPSAILSTYRYCLERGYITNPDSVLTLTADLLMRRTELDQYLLQRRRVTGELLKDLTEAARNEGVTLPEMLVKGGFLSQEDLDTVKREQTRFAMH